jgi:hypothetical protein
MSVTDDNRALSNGNWRGAGSVAASANRITGGPSLGQGE